MVDADPQGQVRYLRVGDRDVRGLGPADVGFTQREPVHAAGRRAAGDLDLHHPVRLGRQAARRAAQADHAALPDGGLIQRLVRRDQPLVHEQADRARRTGGQPGAGERQHARRRGGRDRPGLEQAAQLPGDLGHRGGRVRFQQHVGLLARRRGHDRQREPHRRPPAGSLPAHTARRPRCHFLSAAASWVSVSWKALAAALRYWAMPLRPSIILFAPWVNSV